MKTFKHYIVTRFNIKSEGWKKDKNGNTVNDFNWLEKRYQLFENFCLPSMISQIELDYKWLVFFDTETPEQFKRVNSKIAQKFPQFRPIYVDGFIDFEITLKSIVQKETSVEFVLTTRLDNDDCLHNEAIKEIQSAFKPIDTCIIELTRGLTMQLGKEVKLAKRENLHSGPFITLIENLQISKSIQTVYNCEHTSWRNLAEFIKIDKGFFWLQTIHDSNMANKLHQDLTFNKNLLKGFSFNHKVNFKFSYILFVIFKRLGIFKAKNLFKG